MNFENEHENELRYAAYARSEIATIKAQLVVSEREHTALMENLLSEQRFLRDLDDSLRRWRLSHKTS